MTTKTTVVLNTLDAVGEYVIVTPVDVDKPSDGGILIAEKLEEVRYGEVLSAGNAAQVDLDVGPGDVVCWLDVNQKDLTYSPQRLIALKTESVIAVVK